jgi:surface carbohydrate biosynthesis protein
MGLDFLILYEHVSREYESIVLLKTELERRGYTCRIMQLLDRKKIKYFTWKKPKVLVASAMYDNKTMNSFVYNNVGVCNRVVNLHWEQVLSEEQENSPFFNCGESAAYAMHLCWGQKSRNRLVHYGVPLENTAITGPIQMDFLRSEFKGYYKTKKELAEEFSFDEHKKTALYISSFSTANMSRREINELNDLAGVGFDQFKVTSAKTMDTTLKWVENFLRSEKGKSTEFIYRRHPSEWNSPKLKELSDKYKNFHLIDKYSVKQWILAADTIFTWMSTSIAEIYFAKKSCFVLRPYPIEWEYDPVIYKNCLYIDNYRDFVKAFDTGNPTFPIDEKLLLSHYDVTDTPSYIRIADVLEKTLKEPTGQRRPFDHFEPHFSFLKFFSLIGLHLMYAIRLDPGKLTIFGSLSERAGRIYGHIKNTRVSRADRSEYEKKIKKCIGI